MSIDSVGDKLRRQMARDRGYPSYELAHDEVRQQIDLELERGWQSAGPPEDDVVCPFCNAVNPKFEEHKTPGFTGAPIYVVDFLCCGKQYVDASEDNLKAAE